MRILYFSRDYSPHDYRFLAALAETSHSVHFLRLEQRKNIFEERKLPESIKSISWKGGQRPFTFKDIPGLYLALKGVLRQVKPDLIHAGPLQNCAWLVALTGFRPMVSMSWGYDLMQDAERNAFMRWITSFTLRRSAVMIGDCEAVRKQAIRFGMVKDRIVVFPWGVDLAQFTPEAPNQKDFHRLTLLSVRSWEPIYGVDVLARAFVQVACQRSDICLVMLGGGSQVDLIHKIFSDAGVLDRVIFPGHVGQAALPDYYRRADLYLSASHTDGTSVSLLEALASGCPAIVSDIPGNREWVQPGVNGWLFRDGDSDALAHSILEALKGHEALAEMRLAARTAAEQRADWHKNFPELMYAYELAINS